MVTAHKDLRVYHPPEYKHARLANEAADSPLKRLLQIERLDSKHFVYCSRCVAMMSRR
jgi:hypothetical protein